MPVGVLGRIGGAKLREWWRRNGSEGARSTLPSGAGLGEKRAWSRQTGPPGRREGEEPWSVTVPILASLTFWQAGWERDKQTCIS